MIVCHQDDVCENYIGSVYVGGDCGLSESGLCALADPGGQGPLGHKLKKLLIIIIFI